MNFKVLTEFKHVFNTFEEGNNHDSEKLGLTDELIEVFHRAGWVELEGRENNDLNPTEQEVIPDNVMHNSEVLSNG